MEDSVGNETGVHNWSGWYENPFEAISEAVRKNGTPEDFEKAKASLAKYSAWQKEDCGSVGEDSEISLSAKSRMEILLDAITKSTGLVFRHKLKNSALVFSAAYGPTGPTNA
jgi:hypothetical protein